jgi:hypothetical protein
MRFSRPMIPLAGLLSLGMALAAHGAAAQTSALAHPALWPTAHSTGLVDPVTEAHITALMARMSLEEKVGQMIQADIGSITPEDLRRYPLGSILAGGSSPPLGAPDRSPAAPWTATARAFDAVAQEKRSGHTPIPLMIGIDAVHGNNNVVGATLFPHNSALGAMHDPALIRDIGRATPKKPPPSASTGPLARRWPCLRTFAGAAPMRVTVRTRRSLPPMQARWSRAFRARSSRAMSRPRSNISWAMAARRTASIRAIHRPARPI